VISPGRCRGCPTSATPEAGHRRRRHTQRVVAGCWVDLNRVAQDDPTQGDLVTSAESLRRAMYQLEADGGDSSRDLDAFFSRLESADLPMASRQSASFSNSAIRNG